MDIPNQILTTLQDIASNIQITSEFAITHPQYKPLKLAPEVVVRFQQLPVDLQYKYLSLQLQSFLYETYYSGNLKATVASEQDSSNSLEQDLKERTVMGLNIDFYDQLHESNCGKGYYDSGWRVVREESDGSLAVKKNNLTLHVERDRHLKCSFAAIGDLVAVWTPRNRISKDFYIAIGDAGLIDYSSSNHQSEIINIYFNFSSTGAIAVMNSLTQQLNKIQIPFTFKVLHNPKSYGRYDSGTLYFERCNYQKIHPIIQAIYRENSLQFQAQVPLFTKKLAPGIALAEEPSYEFITQDFGVNRCQIIADGLIAAWQQGEQSLNVMLLSIVRHFCVRNIDLERPYLNPNSEDIYLQLEA